MSKKEIVTIDIDANLLSNTKKILNDLEIDLTSAITAYFNQIVIHQKIPFEIFSPEYYSAEATMGSDWRENLDNVEDEWE